MPQFGSSRNRLCQGPKRCLAIVPTPTEIKKNFPRLAMVQRFVWHMEVSAELSRPRLLRTSDRRLR